MEKLLTDARLLEQIEAFCAKHEMRQSRFGLETMGDGALISQLRAGRSLSLRNAEKIVRYMEAYRPTDTRAA